MPLLRWGWEYAKGLAAFGVALSIQIGLLHVLSRYPFLIFFTAVVVAALYSGFGPAVLVTFLSVLAVDWLVLEPGTLYNNPADEVAMILFVTAGLGVAWLVARRERTEKQYRLLFTQMNDGFALHEIICDDQRWPVDYRFISVNPAFERLTGLKAKDVLGRRVKEVMPDIEPMWIERYGHVALTGEAAQFQGYNRSLDRHFDVAVFCPAPGQFACTFMDTTEHRRAENALRNALSRLDAHMANSPLAIIEFDPQFRITRWSTEAQRLFGWSTEEAVGKAIGEIPWVHPEDVGSVKSISASMVAGREPRNVHPNRNLRKDGSIIYCQWYNSALYDEQGRLTSILSQVQDVTERQGYEEELRRLNQTLEERVRARTAELVSSQAALKQSERLAAIGEMVTGLSHESRNALQRSLACIEMLQKRVKDNAQALTLLQEARKAQLDLQGVYEGVRQYAAPIQLSTRPQTLDEVWRDAWNDLAVQRQNRDAVLIDNTHGVALGCRIDPFRMRQVFRNIFENSLAACADPVEIRIACSDAQLAGRPAVRLSIRDNGKGVTEEEASHLFQAFWTTKTHGTGLGLAIVRRIVEAHGGTIEVGASSGPGLELVIHFPCFEASPLSASQNVIVEGQFQDV